MIKQIILAAAAGTAFAAAAHAADPILPAPAPAPIYSPVSSYNWDGFYIGGNAGAQFSGNTHYVFGGFAGFNFVDGSWLYGAEFQADYVAGGQGFVAWEYAGLARVGTLITPETLVYGAAGINYRDSVPPNAIEGWGYSFGGGFEVAVTENVAVRGELLGQGTFDYEGGRPYAAKAKAGVLFSF